MRASSIPSTIKYHTPVYIHSHHTTLDSNNAINNIIGMKAQTLLEEEKSLITRIASYLRDRSVNNPAVMKFYMDTHDGHTRKTNSEAQKLIDSFKDFRTKLLEIKKAQDKNRTISTTNTKVRNISGNIKEEDLTKTIEEFFNETIAPELQNSTAKELVDFFKSEAQFQGAKKKYKNLDMKDSVTKLLNNKKGVITKEFQRILRKYINNVREQSSGIVEAVNKIDTDVESYISSFGELRNSLLDSNSADKLQHRIDAFNGHNIARYSISGSGSTFEKIFNYLMATEGLDNQINRLDVNYNNENVGSIDSGTSVASGGHGVTTDNVIKIIDDASKKIEVGFSLKASFSGRQKDFNSTFSKKVYGNNLIRERVRSTVFNSESDNNSLLYYLGNDQAFSLFIAPYKYERVIQEEDGEVVSVNIPQASYEPSPVSYDALDRVRSYVVYLLLIKGLLGSLFLLDNFEEAIDSGYVPPVMLSFVTEDYFTCDILDRLLQSIETGVFKKNSSGKDDIVNVPSFYFNADDLEDLFVLKKLIRTSNENRYDDLINNDVSEEYEGSEMLSQYLEYGNVNNLLYSFYNEADMISEIIKEITKPAQFSIPINSFLNG